MFISCNLQGTMDTAPSLPGELMCVLIPILEEHSACVRGQKAAACSWWCLGHLNDRFLGTGQRGQSQYNSDWSKWGGDAHCVFGEGTRSLLSGGTEVVGGRFNKTRPGS